MTTEATFAWPEYQAGPARSDAWVVMKFGGSSVATHANWIEIANRIRRRRADGFSVLVVHSALAGVSDSLHSALQIAATGSADNDAMELVFGRHRDLAGDFGLDADDVLGSYFDELKQLLAGVRLVREVTPRVSARVMALGELMSTTLSVVWLAGEGIRANWQDARHLLRSKQKTSGSERRLFLDADCDVTAQTDPAAVLDTDAVHVTQGFIASNAEGETVLLGRGGSDTSAAYLAAMLNAQRLEIWTDVPGMFSADPRIVPAARLLKQLHYAEAQEIASTGGLVLHPRCIGPVRDAGIPVFVRCTPRPELPGTLIAGVETDGAPSVKAISLRQNITLVSMDGVAMWQEVGFLARVFSVFSEQGVSVDLVSTSESNVTVSIDDDHPHSESDIDALRAALSEHCRVTVIRDCAAVSLVGRRIRAHLHKIGPALSVFEEHKVHLLSQSANDLNLTVVVDDAQGYRLVRQLHPSVIGKRTHDDTFGESWESLNTVAEEGIDAETVWWRDRADDLLALMQQRSHCYVYDAATIKARMRALKALGNIDNVLFAMKANSNPDVLRLVFDAGLGFECVSPGELNRLFELFPGLDPQRVLYTPNFAPIGDYAAGFDRGVRVTLDNLFPLVEWPDVFRGRDLFVRLDPGKGRGHHEHVKTAGVHSKFGIPLFELPQLQALVEKVGCRVTGIHAHSGSGITEPGSWRQVADILVDASSRFPDVSVLDLGGGLGVPEKPGDAALDLAAFDASLSALKTAHPNLELWLEPGRYLVAEAGVLLARVTQTKGKGAVRYVGLSTGMNSLIRPALYGAFHEIVNLSRLDDPADEAVTIVGPICETGDTLGADRLLPATEAGDVILLANAGAYGFVMASRYNLREPAEEQVLPDD